MSNPYQGQPPWGGPPSGDQPGPGHQPPHGQPGPAGWGPASQGSAPPPPGHQPTPSGWGPASQGSAPPPQQPSWGQSAGHQPSAGETLSWGQHPVPPHGAPGPGTPSSAGYPGGRGATGYSGNTGYDQGQQGWGAAPHGPGAQQPGGWSSAPGSPGTMAAPAGPPPKKSATKRILLLVGAGILVLALAIGGFVLVTDMQRQEAERQAAETARIELETQVNGATATVTGFLDAVRDGELETAVSFAVEEPEGPLLEEEIFTAAAEAAEVTDIEVAPAEVVKDANGVYTTATVQASYTLGGTEVDRSWALTNVDGTWKLDEITAPVTLGDREHGLQVNGQTPDIEDSRTEALPGVYAMTTGSEFVSYKAASIVVAEPGKAVSWVADAELTDAGAATAVATARAAFARCLQARSLTPPSCPFSFGVGNGVTVQNDTIRYTSVGDPFSASQPELAGPLIRISATVRVNLTAQGSQGANTGTIRGTFSQTRYAYLLAASPTSAISWRAG